jgi:hypothetical protein
MLNSARSSRHPAISLLLLLLLLLFCAATFNSDPLSAVCG